MPASFTLNTANLLLLLVLVAVSLTTGVADFHWAQLLHVPEQMQLLLVSRIPRTLAVILTGATLAVAGMVLQIVLKNRFIEPNMVGATQSAAVGVLLVSLAWPDVTPLAKMSAATLSALLGMSVFFIAAAPFATTTNAAGTTHRHRIWQPHRSHGHLYCHRHRYPTTFIGVV